MRGKFSSHASCGESTIRQQGSSPWLEKLHCATNMSYNLNEVLNPNRKESNVFVPFGFEIGANSRRNSLTCEMLLSKGAFGK